MKSFITAAVFAGFAALSVSAAESKPDIDVTVLNFALTLEHLENAFYKGALAKFDDKAFKKAGYPAFVRQRIAQIGSDESAHVAFLSGALGSAATKPCEYSFPYKTVDQFLALSRILEGVGVSAYSGAAKLITNEDYLTAAAAILTVEARHQGFVSETQGESGFPTPFDTPLDPSNVYTLAAQFITSCPASNPKFPFSDFPALTVKTAAPKAGKSIGFHYEAPKGPQYYAIFINQLSAIPVALDEHNVAKFPSKLAGTVYIVISKSETLSDADTVAGPAVVELPDPDVHYRHSKHHKH